MTEAEKIRARTMRLAIAAVGLAERLPRSWPAQVLGRQFLRSATSVGANYRAACRTRSRPDFISRMGIVEEEADESMSWLALIREAGLIIEEAVSGLRNECDEMVRIAVASIRTARGLSGAGRQSVIRNPQSAMERSAHA